MMGSIGYSPMGGGGPHVTPGFHIPDRSDAPLPLPRIAPAARTTKTTTVASIKRSAQEITPSAPTPRTSGVRLHFDPSSRKKQNAGSTEEVLSLYFGSKLPPQSKTAVLTVFSFLSNEDLYRAGLVCKEWSVLTMDKELWKFDEH
jgi:F-box-like